MINLLFPILLPIEVALPCALLFALPTMLPVASRWCAQPNLRLPDGYLCRNCAFQVILVARLLFLGAALAANEHKNLDFVLENPENGGSGSQKGTKTPILCSGRRGLAPGREVIDIGERNRCLPANHRARFKNLNSS